MKIFNDRCFGNLADIFKSKYIKRTGSPGNYKYEYKEETGKKKGKGAIRQAEQEYDIVEAQAWKNYKRELKTVKNKQEAEWAYNAYSNVEARAMNNLNRVKKVVEEGRIKRVVTQKNIKRPEKKTHTVTKDINSLFGRGAGSFTVTKVGKEGITGVNS